MRRFDILEYTDDGFSRRQMNSGKDVIEFAIAQNEGLGITPHDTLLQIVGNLLERAAINSEDMVELADMLGFNTEAY